jgi:predicted regulator of Ras-like GTPase activity (Roadblock/LC7/MglB family)
MAQFLRQDASRCEETKRAKMLVFLRNLLARLAPAPVPSPDPPGPLPVLPPAAAANPAARSRPNGNGPPRNGGGIQLPLEAILDGLPLELHPRLRCGELGGQTLSIPLEIILPQLARGVVKISFGALRQAAPGLFSPETDRDDLQVALPLGEILARLNRAFLLRRRSQRQVQMPEEIGGPFDSSGRLVTIAPTDLAQPPPPVPLPLPAATALRRSTGLLCSVPPPAPHDTLIPMPSGSAPAAPLSSSPAGLISLPAQPFVASLASLAEGWPEAVRRDILQLALDDAKVMLPARLLEQGLRQGRVAFRWKTLRSWLTPPPPSTASAQDDTVLEVPLQVVAPLFLARQPRGGLSRRKVSIDESIPNLFFGLPQPEPSPGVPALAAAPDGDLRLCDAAPDALRLTQRETARIPAPETRLVARHATPNEIVSRAAALDHVAGALIGLADGLLVASRLEPDVNGDTLAAFLPQIFGKVSQCTKELRMGELSNLSYTVGNIPWQLFRVNAILFAAFGHPGQPLPAGQLAGLAAELDHKPK